MGLRREILDAVRAVTPGSVVGYGDVARACGTIPVLVGKALAFCDADVPWQRVIGSDGTLRTARRGAALAARQRALLEAEGIRFEATGRVSPDDPAWERGQTALAAWMAKGKGKVGRDAERGGNAGRNAPPGMGPPAGRDGRGNHNGVRA